MIRSDVEPDVTSLRQARDALRRIVRRSDAAQAQHASRMRDMSLSTLCLPLTAPCLANARCVIGTHAASPGARLVLAGTTLHARPREVTRGSIGQQALAARRSAAKCRPREATASETASAGTEGRWPARQRASARCAAGPRQVRARCDAAMLRCSPALPPQPGAVCAVALQQPQRATSTPAQPRTGPSPLPRRCFLAARPRPTALVPCLLPLPLRCAAGSEAPSEARSPLRAPAHSRD